MDKTYNIKMTKRFERAIKAVNSEDKRLTATIIKKIEILEDNKIEQLDIEQIKRKGSHHRIMELKIKSPQNYRVFYVYLLEQNNEILLVDGRRKKVNKFPNRYFEDLDRVIEDYLNTHE